MDDNAERIRRNVAKMRGMGATDAEVEQYLTQHEGLKPADAAPPNGAEKLHAEYKKGLLGKRMARENANDQEAAAVEPGYGERLATHVLNAGQGIPGVEAIEAGAGALGGGMSADLTKPEGRATAVEAGTPAAYRRSLATLRGNTGQIGGKTRFAEKVMGSLAVLPFLPGSPAAAGAKLGAADQALDADADRGVVQRGVRTVAGAAGGALLGKGGELVGTAARAAAATPVATKLMEMKAGRAAKSAVNYAAALLQGKGRTNTPEIQRWLAKPNIAEIADELAQTRKFQGVAREDPKMLDAIYKVLSDRAKAIKRGLESPTPNRPNIGRFRGEDVADAQGELLTALDAPGRETITTATAQSPPPAIRDALDAFRARSGEAARRTQPETVMQRRAREVLERRSAQAEVTPPITGSRSQVVETAPPMPGYRKAVEEYATDSRNIDALRRGNDALRNRLSDVIPSGKNLDRTTPQALQQWAASATPAEQTAARQGVLGALNGQPKITAGRVGGVPLVPFPSKALRAAPDILRTVDPGRQRTIDALVKAGLLVTDDVLP